MEFLILTLSNFSLKLDLSISYFTEYLAQVWRMLSFENPKKAVKWLRLASKQGHAEAQFVLGFLSATGRGVAKSLEQAVQLYKRAAEQGHRRDETLVR